MAKLADSVPVASGPTPRTQEVRHSDKPPALKLPKQEPGIYSRQIRERWRPNFTAQPYQGLGSR